MTGGGGFLTPLGGAASHQPLGQAGRAKSAAYSSLLASALTDQEERQVRDLVARASGRKARTLRDWKRHGVPDSGQPAVSRAAAIWRLGGIERAAEAFGLSTRRTLSWLAGRGRRSRSEQQRIAEAVYSASVGATLRVRVRFNTVSGGATGRSESGREAEVTLDVNETTVETLDLLVRSGDTVAALQILEPLLFEQYMLEQVDMELTEILRPHERAGATYLLTPTGVIGPGYGG
jgi:hypothetical protein